MNTCQKSAIEHLKENGWDCSIKTQPPTIFPVISYEGIAKKGKQIIKVTSNDKDEIYNLLWQKIANLTSNSHK